VYSRAPVEMPVDSERWIARNEANGAARRLRAIPWLKLRAGPLCRRDELTTFWAAAALSPRLPSSVPVVATVHDLNHLLAADTIGRTTRLAHRAWLAGDLRRAAAIVCNSEGTAARVRSTYGVKVEAVVRPGVHASFARPDARTVAAVRARFGLEAPYFLAVGTWEPRKNLEMLVGAYRAAHARGDVTGHALALVGARGWRDEGIMRAVADARGGAADAGRIVPLGFVADGDLPALYAGATAFVFPSRYEGFGMPVLEARAAGARIIASDTPEIREAGGADATYVSPTHDALVDALATAARRARSGAPPVTGSLATWEESGAIMARVLLATARGRE
jgi:glycosyltransferase involved in cell wall biosynthesis